MPARLSAVKLLGGGLTSIGILSTALEPIMGRKWKGREPDVAQVHEFISSGIKHVRKEDIRPVEQELVRRLRKAGAKVRVTEVGKPGEYIQTVGATNLVILPKRAAQGWYIRPLHGIVRKGSRYEYVALGLHPADVALADLTRPRKRAYWRAALLAHEVGHAEAARFLRRHPVLRLLSGSMTGRLALEVFADRRMMQIMRKIERRTKDPKVGEAAREALIGHLKTKYPFQVGAALLELGTLGTLVYGGQRLLRKAVLKR